MTGEISGFICNYLYPARQSHSRRGHAGLDQEKTRQAPRLPGISLRRRRDGADNRLIGPVNPAVQLDCNQR
jgi:hypothetical protein